MPSTSSRGSAYGDTVPRSCSLRTAHAVASSHSYVRTVPTFVSTSTPHQNSNRLYQPYSLLSIGDALHKLAWKRVRRYRTAVLLIKNSTHGSKLALVFTVEKKSCRRQDPTKTRIVCTNLIACWPLRVLYPSCLAENAQPKGSSRPKVKKPSSRSNAQAPQCSLPPACRVPDVELPAYLATVVPRS